MFFNQQASNVDNSKLYTILNITKDAEPETIKKSYKKLAMKWHPDRNPKNKEEAENKFKEISEAYEILSDEKKRKAYDEYGESSFNGNGPTSPFDMFENFFPGNGDFGGMSFGGQGGPFGGLNSFFGNKNKESDIKMALTVNFSDIILGSDKNIKYERKKKCNKCDGIGCSNKSHIIKCNMCNGAGVINQRIQIGPGMYTQNTGVCNECNGKKRSITKGQECNECNGKCYKNENIQINISVPKGTKDGEHIIKEKLGHEIDGTSGNLIIIFKEQNDNKFFRKKNDLILKKKILLSEALCGLEFIIKHPNNEDIIIISDNIIQPDQLKIIKNIGFPVKNSVRVGNLIIQFEIVFPIQLDSNQKTLLHKLLPKRAKIDNNDKECIKEYTLENFNQNEYNEDSEEEEQDGNPQCTQQ